MMLCNSVKAYLHWRQVFVQVHKDDKEIKKTYQHLSSLLIINRTQIPHYS